MFPFEIIVTKVYRDNEIPNFYNLFSSDKTAFMTITLSDALLTICQLLFIYLALI